jgi:predicted metal-dependent peptidase
MLDTIERISKAKSKLVLYHPFFASLICNMPMTEDNNIPTMATNGKRILFNREFVDGMSDDELLFVLCHEVGHCMFGHMFRRGQRNPRKWNIAGDHIINDLLINDKVGTMPAGGLHNPALIAAGNGTTDGVYDLLPDDDDGEGGEGYAGTGIDLCEDAEGDEAERSADEAKMKVQIAQAAQAAKMQGKLSAGLARLVDEVLSPQVPWTDVLRRFVNSKAKVDYSYARPKRRFLASNLYLPSLNGERIGEFVVAIDCSGSIDGPTLNKFAAELVSIFSEGKPAKLHVVYFDSEVVHHDEFTPDDDIHIEPHGGGGTAFSPIFEFVSAQGIDPAGCVVLTDLCCSDFGDQPHYPVLWVSDYSDQAPWGEVIKIN